MSRGRGCKGTGSSDLGGRKKNRRRWHHPGTGGGNGASGSVAHARGRGRGREHGRLGVGGLRFGATSLARARGVELGDLRHVCSALGVP